MEQNPKVSILVPFYNVEKYVGKCVESLFTQTYKNIEYIFVNDYTPDNSLEIINEYIKKYSIENKCKIKKTVLDSLPPPGHCTGSRLNHTPAFLEYLLQS